MYPIKNFQLADNLQFQFNRENQLVQTAPWNVEDKAKVLQPLIT